MRPQTVIAAIVFLSLALSPPATPANQQGPHGASSPPEPSTPVGEIEVLAPEEPEFVLRATLPVPAGVYPRSDGKVPFAVRNRDGLVHLTQVETVTRFANGSLGADVVEVISRVRRPAGAVPGDRLRFTVHHEPHAPQAPVLHPDVRPFANGTAAFRIEASDVFGNTYAAQLSTRNAVRLRDGAVAREWRAYETMLPVVRDGDELSHFFGVHGYIRTFANEPVLQLDLRIHNGFTGLDTNTPIDDPLGEVYFRDIRLVLPAGWVVCESFESPYAGQMTTPSGVNEYALVKPMGGHAVHYMPHQGQMIRRLTIAPLEYAQRAEMYAHGGGQGFSVKGSFEGREYWSFWNPSTAAYYPQRTRLPDLEHLDFAEMLTSDAQQLAHLTQHVRNGTPPGYPIVFPALGWAHPWGQQESGEAGGQEIFLYDGVRIAATASLDGLRRQQLKHRMFVDRHKSAFYNENGTPIDERDWITVSDDGYRWVPFLYFGVPIRTTEHDPFGYENTPSFQRDHVETMGLVPAYRDTLRDFLAIDIEHLVRYTNPAKVLTWLSNDSLAKDSLRMEARAFLAGYHEYPIDRWGWKIGTGLGSDLDFTAAHPGEGMSFGRLEGWGIDVCNVAYAIEDDAYRAIQKPWYDKVLTAVERGQSDCLGIIQADLGDQFFEGRYRTRQSIEQAIVENMLMGVRRGVYFGVDPDGLARLEQVLTRSFYSMVQAPAWDFVRGGPVAKLAVGGHDVTDGLFCHNPPADGATELLDTYQTWCSLAYAHELTGDDLFLRRASEMAAGGDPLTRQLQMGPENLGNRVSLLAYLQRH